LSRRFVGLTRRASRHVARIDYGQLLLLAETMLSNETDRSKVLWDTRSACSASAPDRNLSAPRAQRVAATRAANAFIAASGIDFAAISLRRPKRRN
jgi:hypothetical protein